ncbi:MAG TPA: 4Fe-4S binding protein [Candidatus Lokiarchaeia archaeon]|nr:4Fe-4S binding protein [Candidatus Lokiarchaeia archaeon]
MNWPEIVEITNDEVRTLKTGYITRSTDLTIDTKKCTTCMQCVRACPKGALAKPQLQKGVKTTKIERLPIVVKPVKCVFCGVCMTFCPYDAISMKLDGIPLAIEDLALVKKQYLPRLASVKLGKVELLDPGNTNPFFEKILERIGKKNE